MTKPETNCGYVALLGAPNAGKSTLLNALVGEKLAIVTPKVQTTRTMLRGVLTEEADQIVFIDTPGLFEAKTQFDRLMIGQALQALDEADVCLVLLDAAKKSALREMDAVLKRIEVFLKEKPCALVLTKIDLVKKADLLPMAATLSKYTQFEHIFFISAERKDGVNDVIKYVRSKLPAAPHLYESDDLTDQSLKLTVAEFVREQVFLNMHQEIPYGIAVETTSVERMEDGRLHIQANILLGIARHKGLVIGKGGETLKRIGTNARKQLEDATGERMHLDLTVCVKENWASDRDILQAIGFLST